MGNVSVSWRSEWRAQHFHIAAARGKWAHGLSGRESSHSYHLARTPTYHSALSGTHTHKRKCAYVVIPTRTDRHTHTRGDFGRSTHTQAPHRHQMISATKAPIIMSATKAPNEQRLRSTDYHADMLFCIFTRYNTDILSCIFPRPTVSNMTSATRH